MYRKIIQEYLDLQAEAETIQHVIRGYEGDLRAVNSKMYNLRGKLEDKVGRIVPLRAFKFGDKMVLLEWHVDRMPTITIINLEEVDD